MRAIERVSGQVPANGYLLWVVYPATLTCDVLLSDTGWGDVSTERNRVRSAHHGWDIRRW
jgi:hypothetical protein